MGVATRCDSAMTQAGFSQAGIEIQNPGPFQQLRAAVERALAGKAAGQYLKQLRGRNLRVRDFERVLQRGILDGGATKGWALYQALPVSDQAQMREFYLTSIEAIDPELRRKFHQQFETY